MLAELNIREGVTVKAAIHYIVTMALSLAMSLPLFVYHAQATQGPGFPFGTIDKNNTCLDCHSSMTAVGKNNYIDPMKFSRSTHARIGCSTCHDAIGSKHPDGFQSKVSTGCLDCHKDIGAEYVNSDHVRNASCTSCHNPHTVLTLSEISSEEVRRQCSGCHKNEIMWSRHSRWLPQSELHLETIPCITCHTESRELVVTISIIRKHQATGETRIEPVSHAALKKLVQGGDIRGIIDRNGDQSVSIDELKAFNKNPLYGEYCLAGVMTPSKISHSFKIINNRWDCTYCHAKGPGAVKSSSIVLPMDDGSVTSIPVEKGAILESLNSIPDMYLMGSSRNEYMNKIGLAILGAGMIMPVGHGVLRFLTRRNRNGKEH
jgi:predicted CXXCH cytochrome family protein